MANHMDVHGEHCSRLVQYRLNLDEYSIPDYVAYPEGDGPRQVIYFCPWCGERLPASNREAWYVQLEAMGIDPMIDEIPRPYLTDE